MEMKEKLENTQKKEYNELKQKIEQLESQKMSRQKLQCTPVYKENIRAKRRMGDEKRKLELHRDIAVNPTRSQEEWEKIFETDAKRQIEKNLKDKNKRRISAKTYEKRERRVMAEYKEKLENLKKINSEIEKYGISRKSLELEYNSRIQDIENRITEMDNTRKRLRDENNLKNQKIDEQKSVLEQKLLAISQKLSESVSKENDYVDISFGNKVPKKYGDTSDISFANKVPKKYGDTSDISFARKDASTVENTRSVPDIKFAPNQNSTNNVGSVFLKEPKRQKGIKRILNLLVKLVRRKKYATNVNQNVDEEIHIKTTSMSKRKGYGEEYVIAGYQMETNNKNGGNIDRNKVAISR